MTHADIARLRELIEVATSAPWVANASAVEATNKLSITWCGSGTVNGGKTTDNAALIAAAVTALPALLDELEAARGAISVLRRKEFCPEHWSLRRPTCEMCKSAEAFERKRKIVIDTYDNVAGIRAVKL